MKQRKLGSKPRVKYKQLHKELEEKVEYLNNILKKKDYAIELHNKEIAFLKLHNNDLYRLMSWIKGCVLNKTEEIQYDGFQTLACRDVQQVMVGKTTKIVVEFIIIGEPI